MARIVRRADTEHAGRTIDASEVACEVARFQAAVAQAVSELKGLESRVSLQLGEDKAGIFAAQQMMVEDIGDSVKEQIEGRLVSAERACTMACEQQAQTFLKLDDPYFRARADDLRDIGRRLVRCLLGADDVGPEDIPERTVVVAENLMPSDTARLDKSRVAAIVLDQGGVTSHAAILAQSLGIPAVVATRCATSIIRDLDSLLVDADGAVVEVNPSADRVQAFEESISRASLEQQRLESLSDLPGITLDGRRVEIAANIGQPDEVGLVIAAGGEGVGLFRTEFLFLNRETAPDEDEQYEAYRVVLSGLAPSPVVIRTLDIGGDKSIPYLSVEPEENPFLGLRAIRLCLEHRSLFRAQLRALMRASVHGSLRIMFPMISNLVELREAKQELEAVKAELAAEGKPLSDHVEVGIMVEVPSAAIDADILAKECDFFSIGTNDLVQYTMAADRGNSAVASLSTPFQPAVLRLIARTIEEGHKRGIWVGLCGEMAGNPLAVALLVGMGIDELSMSPRSIPRAKSIVRTITSEEALGIWQHVKALTTQDEITKFLKEAGER
jgi:phosphotransferase system enzyme I (PtsI)